MGEDAVPLASRGTEDVLRRMPFLCRDECLGAAMIAACQHDDWECLAVVADRLGGPAEQKEVIEAALAFALTLAALDQRLMRVPANVVRSLVDKPPTHSYHLFRVC